MLVLFACSVSSFSLVLYAMLMKEINALLKQTLVAAFSVPYYRRPRAATNAGYSVCKFLKSSANFVLVKYFCIFVNILSSVLSPQHLILFRKIQCNIDVIRFV